MPFFKDWDVRTQKLKQDLLVTHMMYGFEYCFFFTRKVNIKIHQLEQVDNYFSFQVDNYYFFMLRFFVTPGTFLKTILRAKIVTFDFP